MDIIISNASDKPIYDQIATQIKQAILSGELNAGDSLPSIRALARDLQEVSLQPSEPTPTWKHWDLLKPARVKAALWQVEAANFSAKNNCVIWKPY